MYKVYCKFPDAIPYIGTGTLVLWDIDFVNILVSLSVSSFILKFWDS